MDNFKQKFKLFKHKNRNKPRKLSQTIATSIYHNPLQQSLKYKKISKSLEKSRSLDIQSKQIPDPVFPRYSLIAFFNPKTQHKNKPKIKNISFSKPDDFHSEIKRCDLPTGYVNKMRCSNLLQNPEKTIMRLSITQKHKNRKQLFMKTLQNTQCFQPCKLKDLVIKKYKKQFKQQNPQAIDGSLYVEGETRNTQYIGEYLLKGLPVRVQTALKTSRRKTLLSQNSSNRNSCLTTARNNMSRFGVIEPWQDFSID